MAIVTVPGENRTIKDQQAIAAYLAAIGIDYERWEPKQQLAEGATADEVLQAYAAEIETLKSRGGYVTADVIDVHSETPGVEAMLAKFNREHWHDEDEVRFVISGRGIFHIHSRGGEVVAIEVTAGDLIRVPRGTFHWFNLCDEHRIRAIRLFQDKSGWTPHYTESYLDRDYLPVCFGPPPQG